MSHARLLAAVIIPLLAACAPAARPVPGMKFSYAPAASWDDYCRTATLAIMRARGLDGHGPRDGTVIAANRPFELKPAGGPPWRRGIIMIHGLTDSPYIMKPLGRYFQKKGFLVRGLLLPGHGTRPADLTTVRLEDWEKAVAWAAARTAPLVDELYLCGFSTGGGLACAYALSHPGEVKAMFLISPALRIKSPWAWAALPLSRIKKYLAVRENLDYARYESFATNGAAQVWRLTRKIGDLAGSGGKTPPVFLVVSADDTVIDPGYALEFFSERFPDPRGRAIVYANHETGTGDPRITTVPAAFPADRIVDYSHLAPPVPPDDPHYGRNGDYRNCYHYLRPTNRRKCREGKADLRGEVSAANLGKGVLERLTYNPRYPGMLAAFDRFLARLGKGGPP